MAPSGHWFGRRACPLLGVKRTSRSALSCPLLTQSGHSRRIVLDKGPREWGLCLIARREAVSLQVVPCGLQYLELMLLLVAGIH